MLNLVRGDKSIEEILEIIKGKTILKCDYEVDRDCSDLYIYFTDGSKIDVNTEYNFSGMWINEEGVLK